MIRFLAVLALAISPWGSVASAQGTNGQSFSALARLDPLRTGTVPRGGGAQVTLGLSQPVPYRVALWANPPRLVLDFRTLAFERLTQDNLLAAAWIDGQRTGLAQGDWSRLVLDLAQPVEIRRAGMRTDPVSGTAQIQLDLVATDAERFAELASTSTIGPEAPAPTDTTRFVVALDPGHGGTDTGAKGDGVSEADAMLSVARALRDELRRAGGVDVVLTREADVFVSMETRLLRAKQAGADLFVSLQADAFASDATTGVRVFTLSKTAANAATQQLAERRARGDLLSGVDLQGQDDQVARVLLSMARSQTKPRAEALAQRMVTTFEEAEIALHRRPLDEARSAVLKSADMPSILIDLGQVKAGTTFDAWRREIADAMAAAVLSWKDGESDQP